MIFGLSLACFFDTLTGGVWSKRRRIRKAMRDLSAAIIISAQCVDAKRDFAATCWLDQAFLHCREVRDLIATREAE